MSIMSIVSDFKGAVIHAAAKTVFTLKKHAPEIMTVGGVASMIGGSVWGCVESTKLPTVMEEHKNEILKIRSMEDNGEMPVDEAKKLVSKRYFLTAKKLGKMYAGPVILTLGGAASVGCSHLTMAARNAQLATTAASLTATLNNTYDRMEKVLGKEKADQIRYDMQKEMTVVEETAEDGTVTRKEQEVVVPKAEESCFCRYFRSGDSQYWTADAKNNRYKLGLIETDMNRRLRQDGYLFLNDVLDALGMKRTAAGNNYGWVYNRECPEKCFVDFGLHNGDEVVRAFMNGTVAFVLLRFNVQGDILNDCRSMGLLCE